MSERKVELTTRSAAIRRYAAARSCTTESAAVSLLQMGDEETVVISGTRAEPATLAVLAIGYGGIARGIFRHAPPTAAELEDAMAAIEDEVMKIRALIPRDSALFTADAVVRRIARVAGMDVRHDVVLDIDAVERTFERLAAILLGRPVAQDPMPVEAEFAAALMILREVMHHLQFGSITAMGADA